MLCDVTPARQASCRPEVLWDRSAGTRPCIDKYNIAQYTVSQCLPLSLVQNAGQTAVVQTVDMADVEPCQRLELPNVGEQVFAAEYIQKRRVRKVSAERSVIFAFE